MAGHIVSCAESPGPACHRAHSHRSGLVASRHGVLLWSASGSTCRNGPGRIGVGLLGRGHACVCAGHNSPASRRYPRPAARPARRPAHPRPDRTRANGNLLRQREGRIPWAWTAPRIPADRRPGRQSPPTGPGGWRPRTTPPAGAPRSPHPFPPPRIASRCPARARPDPAIVESQPSSTCQFNGRAKPIVTGISHLKDYHDSVSWDPAAPPSSERINAFCTLAPFRLLHCAILAATMA